MSDEIDLARARAKKIFVIEGYKQTVNRAAALTLKKDGYTGLITKTSGVGHLDLEALKRQKIRVENLKEYHVNSLVEFAVLQVLWLSRNMTKGTQSHSLRVPQGHEIAKKNVLIIGGAGKVGSRLCKVFQALEANVIPFDTGFYPNDNKKMLYKWLREANLIMLCIPDKNTVFDNKDFLGEKEFEQIKKGGTRPYIINPNRASLVNQKSIEKALVENTIAGYACDEMPEGYLRGSLNCWFTPHIAVKTIEAIQKKNKEYHRVYSKLSKTISFK